MWVCRLSRYGVAGLLISLLTIGFGMTSLPGHAGTTDDLDLLWLLKLNHPLSQDRDLKIELSGKSDESITDGDLSSVDVGLFFRLSPHWQISPRYRHVETSGKTPAENRWHVNLEYFNQAGQWKYEFRTRYEYRSFTNNTIDHRLYERVRCYLPLNRRDSLLVMTKLYYDLDKDEWVTMIPAVGVKRKLSANHSVEVYYGQDLRRSGSTWRRRTHLVSVEYSMPF